MKGTETKIFDPADGFGPLQRRRGSERPDRGQARQSMVAGQRRSRSRRQTRHSVGQRIASPRARRFSASGWALTPDPEDPHRVALLAGQEIGRAWDLHGGRHCPSYVRGWDPDRGEWAAAHLDYAGAAENLWRLYTIGYLEWDGTRWADGPAPVFTASEDWERGSVYQPKPA